jgi:hypothetical protein
MVFHGFFESLPQVVVGAVFPRNDVGMAMDYLRLTPTVKSAAALTALAVIVAIAISLTRPLLELAQHPSDINNARKRNAVQLSGRDTSGPDRNSANHAVQSARNNRSGRNRPDSRDDSRHFLGSGQRLVCDGATRRRFAHTLDPPSGRRPDYAIPRLSTGSPAGDRFLLTVRHDRAGSNPTQSSTRCCSDTMCVRFVNRPVTP